MSSNHTLYRLRITGNDPHHLKLLWTLISLAAVFTAGCERSGPRITAAKLEDPGTAYGENRDHLILALDFLDSFHEYDPNEMMPRILNHLQTWVADAEPVDDWIADPLYGRLPRRLNLSNDPIALSRLRFQNIDISALREAMWLREIADQVCQREVPPELMEWLAAQEAALGIDGSRDLACAAGLFDWVVRNIQIEPPPEPDEDGVSASARFSWEALLLGRADPWVRAQLFILLCRQARIPAVMLGMERDGEPTDPWAVGVWISQRLYLFDPVLGLPLPSGGDRGIAHLAEVLEDPGLLQQLDVDNLTYPVGESELRRLVAMPEGSVPYLSQRMRVVEAALSNQYRMVLSTAPSALARELREAFPNLSIELWTLPYDTMQRRTTALREDPRRVQAIERELSLFLENTPVASGRREHFRGRLADDPPTRGAKSWYIQCRMPNAEIERLNAEKLRGLYGIPRELNDPALLAQLVPAARERARLAKQYASYWLGILAFEEGRYDVAADYFRKRTLEAYPDGLWAQGARYNLARTLEMLGREADDAGLLQEAITLYEEGDSPQAHGNRIRARRLK